MERGVRVSLRDRATSDGKCLPVKIAQNLIATYKTKCKQAMPAIIQHFVSPEQLNFVEKN